MPLSTIQHMTFQERFLMSLCLQQPNIALTTGCTWTIWRWGLCLFWKHRNVLGGGFCFIFTPIWRAYFSNLLKLPSSFFWGEKIVIPMNDCHEWLKSRISDATQEANNPGWTHHVSNGTLPQSSSKPTEGEEEGGGRQGTPWKKIKDPKKTARKQLVNENVYTYFYILSMYIYIYICDLWLYYYIDACDWNVPSYVRNRFGASTCDDSFPEDDLGFSSHLKNP